MFCHQIRQKKNLRKIQSVRNHLSRDKVVEFENIRLYRDLLQFSWCIKVGLKVAHSFLQ